MRALKFFLPAIVAFALAGCASYHLGPVNGAVAGEKSISIQPFNNQTFQPRLGEALTQTLRERLQQDATYQLDTHGTGDLVVSGVIRNYVRVGLNFLSTDTATPENYRVEATVHLTVRERASGRLVLDKDVKGHVLTHIGGDLASAERQALPLLAEDLTRNIAALLTEGAW